jgi:hypothetical protein
MAERVVLHVGAMKSGTSYLQAQLFANKDTLAPQGVLVPGSGWGDQVAGVLDVLGKLRYGRESVDGAWQKLMDEVDVWPGTAVVSMEFLGPVSRDKVSHVVGTVRALSSAPRVSVVLTARDLNRSIAAMWQETVQNGRWWTWQEYLDGVEEARPRPERDDAAMTKAGRTFWRQQNLVRISKRWGQADGVSDYSFVTVPAPGAPPELLMQRFAEVVGFTANGLKPGPRANASLGAASAEALRRINVQLAERGLMFPLGARLRKHVLAKEILAARSGEEPKIGLPVVAWVKDYAPYMVAELRGMGIEPVGEWSDLEPVPVSGIDLADLADEDVEAAARAGLAGLRPRLGAELGREWPSDVGTTGAVAALAEVVTELVERTAHAR